MRKLIISLLVLALAGCASEQNQQLLAHYLWDCQQGNQQACEAIPVQQRINQDETNLNVARTALVIVLLPLAILALAYSGDGGNYSHSSYHSSYGHHR